MRRMKKAEKIRVCLRREDFRAIEVWGLRFGDLAFLVLDEVDRSPILTV